MKNKRNIIDEFLKNRTEEEKAKDAEWDKNFQITFNLNSSLDRYKYHLDILRKNGFYPIGVTTMYLEDTFIFPTKQEALQAYHTLERNEEGKVIGKVTAWFYGKNDFMEACKQYKKEFEREPYVIWFKTYDRFINHISSTINNTLTGEAKELVLLLSDFMDSEPRVVELLSKGNSQELFNTYFNYIFTLLFTEDFNKE